MNSKTKTLFTTGQIVGTPGALEALKANGQSSFEFLQKHTTGIFGDLCKEDILSNESAIKNNSRIFSAYLLKDETKIWIITEADRSSTCILLPEEY